MWVLKKLCDEKRKGLSVSGSTKNKITNILILSVVKKIKMRSLEFF